MGIATFAYENLNRIPTRFDDIQKEIKMEKVKQYFEQKQPKLEKGTYLLGDVLGKVFDKVV